MRRTNIQPRFDFETIKAAVGRWREDNAPGLTRDEAVRHIVGEWLESRGYMQTEAGKSRAGNWVLAVVTQGKVPGS